MTKKRSRGKGKTQTIRPTAKLNSWKLYVLFAAAFIIVVVLVILIVRGGRDGSIRNMNIPVKQGSALDFKKQGELRFISSAGEQRAAIEIEIADDLRKITQGLMFRDKLEENQGMLFIFPSEDYRSFWMKNTSIPLDMLFVSSEGEIIDIHKFTTPFSEKNYLSDKPAQYVVEVNAGFTDKYYIDVGDKIIWNKIAPAQ
jgi:uncharacterized membrane protein (UPF0127 family)